MGNLLSSIDEDNYSISNSNTTSSSPFSLLNQAESLRREAHQLRSEAQRAAQQSQREYHSGSKAQAKVLSIEKADLYKRMNEKNRQAAELFIKHYNQNHPNNIIDLHGLYVAEALGYLQEKLIECRSKNIQQLTVITGMGNNSPNKIARIKPEVEKFARQNCLKITCYSGHVIVDLKTDNQSESIRHQNTNECIIL